MLIILVILTNSLANSAAVIVSNNICKYSDIEYARINSKPLLLDLYVPKLESKPWPLIIWVHGGGWCDGTKSNAWPVSLGFTQKGYAVAAIDYRFTDEAVFPAQIWDCKAAIKYLRANAKNFNLDPNHFGVWGNSAGGHLAALLGVTSNSKVLDGNEGIYISTSSSVQAVGDFCGPTDLTTVDNNDPNSLWLKPNSIGARLIGLPLIENRAKAWDASPMKYISKDSAPFLIVHGENDRNVPLAQSITFYNCLRKNGVEANLVVLKNVGHSGEAFVDSNAVSLVQKFFSKYLK